MGKDAATVGGREGMDKSSPGAATAAVRYTALVGSIDRYLDGIVSWDNPDHFSVRGRGGLLLDWAGRGR